MRQRVNVVWLVLLLVLATAVLLRFAAFTGLIASDDVFYSYFAEQIAAGTYTPMRLHFAVRYGLLLPVAFIYGIAGISEATTVALPMIASPLAAVLLAALAYRLGGLLAAVFAGILFATFPVEVRYASILVPEPVLQCVLIAGAHVYLSALNRHSKALGVLAGSILAFAYMVKEPAAFIVMAFVAAAVFARRPSLALSVACGAALVVSVEAAWYWASTRDVLFRVHSMEIHNTLMAERLSGHALFQRLFIEYPRQMLVPNVAFGLHSIVTLGLAAAALVVYRRSAVLPCLLLWAVLPFLYLNFGSTSMSTYFPLPVAPRYLSISYPPLFLLVSLLVAGWIGKSKYKVVIASAALLVVAATGAWCALATRGTGYRTEDMRRLKQIAREARGSGACIDVSEGPVSRFWMQSLHIIAPDVLACDETRVRYTVVPDENGLPARR